MTLPKSQESRVESQEPESEATQRELRHSTLDSRLSTLDLVRRACSRAARRRGLGQALADQLRLYRDAPLAGVVVISDGAQNAGVEPDAAVEAAREAKVPLYTDRRRLDARRSGTSRCATWSCRRGRFPATR